MKLSSVDIHKRVSEMTAEELLKELADSEALFLTIVGEARGEPVEGQIAVANVILNRAKKRRQSIKEVCLAHNQFSCWNYDDPNRILLEELAKKILKGNYIYNDYKQIQWVIEGVIGGKLDDNTRGTDHYMTTGLFYSENRPSWATNPKKELKIGEHTFLLI